MNLSNYPVTSREYKLMLNTDRFKDREEGCQVFLNLIEFLIKKEGGTIEKSIKNNKEEKRQTSYLDTPELALRQQGYSLRLRKENKAEDGFQLNLKYRSSDRYISANQDLSSTETSKYSHKFEEDILPPFVSKFSHSASIKFSLLPDLTCMQQVVALFPGLKKLAIDKKTAIKTIKDFEAFEVVRKLCKFSFSKTADIKACLSFWYLTEEMDGWPLVSEFSFDYDMPDEERDDEKLEKYPSQAAEGANRFFNALQNQAGWINFNTTTKTAFALEAL